MTEPTLEERVKRLEMILGLRPHGELLLPGEPGPPTSERSVPGPNGSRMAVAVGGSN